MFEDIKYKKIIMSKNFSFCTNARTDPNSAMYFTVNILVIFSFFDFLKYERLFYIQVSLKNKSYYCKLVFNPPANGANEQSKICVVGSCGNFFNYVKSLAH